MPAEGYERVGEDWDALVVEPPGKYVPPPRPKSGYHFNRRIAEPASPPPTPLTIEEQAAKILSSNPHANPIYWIKGSPLRLALEALIEKNADSPGGQGQESVEQAPTH